MALAALAIGLAGFSTYAKGLAALRHARLNINALMTVAVTGAFLIGQWPEAAMVMALYAIAEWIEARAVDRARNAIQGLLSLTPETAEVQQADGAWAGCAGRSGGRGRHHPRQAGRAHSAGRCDHVRAAAHWTRARSPARACRPTRRWATRCSRAPST